MKKLFVSLAMLSALVACNKEAVQEEQEQPAGNKQIITATVNTPTKVDYSEVTPGGGAGLTSVWAEGDQFYAIQDGAKVVTFKLVSGAGETTATFTAETEGATAYTQWKAVLGGKADAYSSEVHCGYMKQNGTVDNLSDYNYVISEGTGKTPEFNFATGSTKLSYTLRIKLPAGIKCIEYTPCAYHKITSSEESIIYLNAADGEGSNEYGPSKTSTITLDHNSTKGEIIYIALPAIDFSTTLQTWNGKQNGNLRTGIVVTLLNDTSNNANMSTGWVYGAHREGGDLTAKGGMINTLDMSEATLICRATPAEAIEIATSNVSCTLHASLTQAATSMTTYWAPFNLGASKISEAGLYIAFGEYWDNKSYSWGSYQQRHRPNGSNFYEDYMTPTTKAIGAGQNAYYSIAGSRFDAARVLWGSAWRMPHAVEIYGMSTKGTETFTKEDGVNCATFTVNGNTVKFPDSGYYMRDKDQDSGAIQHKDVGYAYIRSADKLQRTQTTSNTIYRECYSYWMGVTASAESSDPRDFTRSLGFRGYPVRAVLAKSTIN